MEPSTKPPIKPLTLRIPGSMSGTTQRGSVSRLSLSSEKKTGSTTVLDTIPTPSIVAITAPTLTPNHRIWIEPVPTVITRRPFITRILPGCGLTQLAPLSLKRPCIRCKDRGCTEYLNRQRICSTLGRRGHACHIATSTGFQGGRTGRPSQDLPNASPAARSAIRMASGAICGSSHSRPTT
jgi:hypothetical protein